MQNFLCRSKTLSLLCLVEVAHHDKVWWSTFERDFGSNWRLLSRYVQRAIAKYVYQYSQALLERKTKKDALHPCRPLSLLELFKFSVSLFYSPLIFLFCRSNYNHLTNISDHFPISLTNHLSPLYPPHRSIGGHWPSSNRVRKTQVPLKISFPRPPYTCRC